MRRSGPFSVLSAMLAVCLLFVSPAIAAPTSPPPPAASVEVTFEFSVPPHWRPVGSQEQGSVTMISFLLDAKGSTVTAVYGNFGHTASALVERNVAAAKNAGFTVVGTLTSPDHTFVATRLRRSASATDVDEAVIAARMSPDAPEAGILMIGRWGLENGNAYASQVLASLREATMVKTQ